MILLMSLVSTFLFIVVLPFVSDRGTVSLHRGATPVASLLLDFTQLHITPLQLSLCLHPVPMSGS